MLITFQSKAAPDVTMLKDLAGYLLGLVGKRLDVRGVITREQLPGAIERLEAAIVDDKNTEEGSAPLHHTTHANAYEHRAGLSQRAYPFLDMLRQARDQEADVIWGL
ncbi:hypothetical protein AWB67_06987 [Caballeronia terrestris]|jgi:hypothetical protein|uniref:DUF1840 domain-containing protein n=1 Tax=Caballeronia terrestris TaxID=1226301 RepID=A0A158KYX1_9BURK|nr:MULTISPECIES: DUF1840 domain-containing protein [Caballeronia]SAK87232.1 hypothetical protein AWB81_04511 [Caballeronia arationis]SAL85601.1 hypothetical protein AWB67_06987 [Caballeronia terrestris]